MNTFPITNEHIANTVETVSSFLGKYDLEAKDILRVTLALEDTLLNYQETFGENTSCHLKCVCRFGRLRIELSVTGSSYNPFVSDDEEDFSRLLMAGMGMAPDWKYRNGQNVIVFTPKKKKRSQMISILAAIALALVCGALSVQLPKEARDFLLLKLLMPVSDTYLGLLNAVAGIMIFLSVAWSICSIGDVSTLTNIGKKMLSHMLLMMILLPTLFTLCILPFFDLSNGTEAGSIDLSAPFSMLLGIVPTDLLTPFIQGNFLQIIFLAAITGIALLVLGSKTSLIAAFIQQADSLVQLILEVICSFLPLVIFLSFFQMILSGSFTVLLEAYKAPLFLILGGFSVMLLYLGFLCLTLKADPVIVLGKMMPPFFIGLTTASSSAAMAATMDICENQLGIDKKIVNFGVPLGQIVFGIGSVMEFIVLAFCMAEIYDVSVTPVWTIMTILISVILTVAAPPIPGGSVALCTILFQQLGLPLEGLAIAVAIDVIADFFITAMDLFCQQSELVLLSGKLHMLDLKKLRKKNPA